MIKISRFDSVLRFDLARKIPGMGLYWTSAYYVDGIMMDTGCHYTASELLETTSKLSIRKIVNTHSHEDHIGTNALLENSIDGLDILAHPLAMPVLTDPKGKLPLRPYQRLLYGWPKPSNGKPIQDQEIIETKWFNFQVIYTPGHSPDHICLYEPEQGWLFTGDLFVGGQDRALRADYEIWQIIASLKKIAELPLTMLFPGSARVRENPKEEIMAKITYLEELGHRVLELHQKGWGTRKIARTLLGSSIWMEVFTLGNFSRRNLVNSYLRNTKKI